MKKILSAIFLTALLSPALAFAQTPQEEYQTSLRQLIVLLVQQVTELQAQLQLLKGGAAIGAVGAPLVVPELPTSKSQGEMKLSLVSHTQVNDSPAFGSYIIQVSVYDASGENVRGAKIDMVSDQGTTTNAAIAGGYDGSDWYINFEYAPSTPGTHTLTFLSKNASATYTLEAQ